MRTPSLYSDIKAEFHIIARESYVAHYKYIDRQWREIKARIYESANDTGGHGWPDEPNTLTP